MVGVTRKQICDFIGGDGLHMQWRTLLQVIDTDKTGWKVVFAEYVRTELDESSQVPLMNTQLEILKDQDAVVVAKMSKAVGQFSEIQPNLRM